MFYYNDHSVSIRTRRDRDKVLHVYAEQAGTAPNPPWVLTFHIQVVHQRIFLNKGNFFSRKDMGPGVKMPLKKKKLLSPLANKTIYQRVSSLL